MTSSFIHTTPSGNKTIYKRTASIDILSLRKYIDTSAVINACKVGCINYNHKWCCPPFSKPIDTLLQNYSFAFITCLYIYLADMGSISRDYQKIKAANMILKSQNNKATRKLEMELKGLALLDGSCNLCKPCKKKLDQPCKKPDKMRFSMESTGINVCKLLKDTMSFELQWYKKGYTPEYTAVTSCILYN